MNRSSRRQGFTVVELLVLIGLIVFAIAIFVPWRTLTHTRHRGTQCANNLRQIGLALVMYTNDNRGEYPSTGFDYTRPNPVLKLDETGRTIADGSVLVDGVPRAGWNNVTASWFLLARTQGLTMEVFTCPSTGDIKDPVLGDPAAPANIGDINKHANFTSIATNLSYGFAPPETNAAGQALGYRLTKALSADFPIAADRYQGSTIGGPPSTNVNDTPASQMKMNSANHGRDGQNIMYADAHVSFEGRCFVGVNQNNIYYADYGAGGPATPTDFAVRVYPNGAPGAKANVQLPTNADDSVLLPWASDNQ